MSTPCGVHKPISPDTFSKRVDEWFARTRGTEFEVMGFEQAMSIARHGDLIYCDPPYTYTQSILYGAQSFSLQRLLEVISDCKDRGVFVALSIDGSKRSGNFVCDLPIPSGLFEREVSVNVGRSMLRRFQMKGRISGRRASCRSLTPNVLICIPKAGPRSVELAGYDPSRLLDY